MLPQPWQHDVIALHGPEFAKDPHAVYARLREYGALAPVEISPGVGAMLVTDYRAALDLLNDPVTWSKDSREWQKTVPGDSPVLPMLGWRPNMLFNDGETHSRYRRAIVDSLDMVEPHELRSTVVQLADTLIARFAADGTVDLIGQYARVLPLLIFNRLFGMPDSYSDRLVNSLAMMMESDPTHAAEGNAAFESYIGELIGSKKQQRGHDLTSWLMDHPSGLADEEIVHQIVLTMGAGHEPTTNLIGNALARMLSDDRYYSTLSGGALTPRDAIHDVLQNEPPMSNYSAHYPRRDVFFHGTWVRTGQLVLVSYAAANAQFGRQLPGTGGGAYASGGGSHLAWSAGPHSCPAKQPGLLIAMTAIERLTAWLSDIELTVTHDQLAWRQGPFHRALTELPARFTPLTPEQAGATPWDNSLSSSIRPEGISTARTTDSANWGRPTS
ncbi:cytochrome P450 [Streptomyces sp. NPDC005438]|uniref:cytochrome P450 n=1 Tax=Streptomyces sp. NPDC005438 TaxID=3156880 RepID=UPI0033B54249